MHKVTRVIEFHDPPVVTVPQTVREELFKQDHKPEVPSYSEDEEGSQRSELEDSEQESLFAD